MRACHCEHWEWWCCSAPLTAATCPGHGTAVQRPRLCYRLATCNTIFVAAGNQVSALLAVGTQAGIVLLFHLSMSTSGHLDVATSEDEPGREARRLRLVGHRHVSSSALASLVWLPQNVPVATDGVNAHHDAAILAVRLPPSMVKCYLHFTKCLPNKQKKSLTCFSSNACACERSVTIRRLAP